MQTQLITRAENGFVIYHNCKNYIETCAEDVVSNYVRDFKHVIYIMKPGEKLQVELNWELNPVDDIEIEDNERLRAENLAEAILQRLISVGVIKGFDEGGYTKAITNILQLIFVNNIIQFAVDLPKPVNRAVTIRKVKENIPVVLNERENKIVECVLDNLHYDEATPVKTTYGEIDIDATLSKMQLELGHIPTQTGKNLIVDFLQHIVYK